MATKYILDPSGDIIKVEDGKIVPAVDENAVDGSLGVNPSTNNAYLSDVFSPSDSDQHRKETDRFLLNVDLGTGVELEGDFFLENGDGNASEILSDISHSNSFGFKKDDNGENISIDDVKAFRPFNSFLDEGNRVFADEFEILTGMRFREGEATESLQVSLMMFTYLIEILTRIAVIEGIILINKGISDSVTGPLGQTSERFTLRLGKYDYTEYDIFTKYVFNVLNYPHESSSAVERINAYLIGFAEWLAPDAFLDYNEMFKEGKSGFLNSIDYQSSGSNREINQTLTTVSTAFLTILEVTLSSLTNHTVINRARLLLRKFYQERIWKKRNLYSAKQDASYVDYFDDLNYYYIKFFIERVQVGLPILKKYLYDDSYLQIRQPNTPLNRVSGNRGKPVDLSKQDELANTKYQIVSKNSEEKYEWMYSKSGDEKSLPTSLRSLPQAFVMHESLYKTLLLNGKKSINYIDTSISQNFVKTKNRRISEDLVKNIENSLECEYMPFYFHDLRTNEILSFHAFIENISDSFSPEYNSASGFGRIDDVKSYVKTTRNISLTFILAATSELDHDLMWYQINKIVAMVYPQWSDAFSVDMNEKENPFESFKYPFTQVPTSSPLIRLRVGDVIKSNYSRTNLSRLHGIGDRDIDKKEYQEELAKKYLDESIKLSKEVEELEKYKSRKKYNKEIKDKAEDLKNKAESLKGESYKLKDNITEKLDLEKAEDSKEIYILPGLYRTANESKGNLETLANITVNFQSRQHTKKITHETKVHKIVSKYEDKDFITVKLNAGDDFVLVVDKSKVIKNSVKEVKYLLSDYKTASKNITKPVINEKSNNPITKAYESGMSRGLAGFITNLDLSYSDSTWETSRIGSKAPMLVKLSISFSPIHDIPPGLDHNGMLRAPVYNVGRINNEFFGDPQDGDEAPGDGREAAVKKYKAMMQALIDKRS